jgi:3-oxoacyl-[acyl-carrier-protein] synthase-3
MADLRFHNVGIHSIAACVPAKIESNDSLRYLIPEEDIEKTINNIGIREKRIADPDVCASDLCLRAAEQLITENAIDKESIQALIFVSQTSDYHQPATAPILQHELGLSQGTLSFDVNLACSGYVYGLSIAYSFCTQLGCDRVLLLVGETMSKIVSEFDRESKPLFGDAGTATLIEKGDYGETFFSLNSDGSGADIMMIPAGGFRIPSSAEAFAMQEDGKGNKRNQYQFRMDGMDVFNFGIRVEPKDIKHLLTFAGTTIDNIDLLIFHQANKFMTDFFTKRLKFSTDKTPYSLDRFGNTSSASIPLTIVSELYDGYSERKRTILSGFGAGLSWGSVLLDLSSCRISKLTTY